MPQHGHWKARLVTLSLVVPGLAAGVPSHAAPYSIVDLGAYGSEFPVVSDFFSLSSSTRVAGWSEDANGRYAFVWENLVDPRLPSLPGGGPTSARGINSLGHVAGRGVTADGNSHAVLWKDGNAVDLGALLGGTHANAMAVNALDQVVGWGNVSSPPAIRGFVYESGPGMQELPPLDANYRSDAYDINDSGKAVGYSKDSDELSRAVLWEKVAGNWTVRDLGTFSGGLESEAHGINNSGLVVGWAETADGIHAFLWDGNMADLGTLGGTLSEAHAINGSGLVVGMSETAVSDEFHAFLWKDGNMVDLNGLIPSGTEWELVEAWDINDSGRIVGWGYLDDEPHAFVLVPEPASMGIVLLGAGGLLRRLRRRSGG